MADVSLESLAVDLQIGDYSGGSGNFVTIKKDGGIEKFTAGVSDGSYVTDQVTDALSAKLQSIQGGTGLITSPKKINKGSLRRWNLTQDTVGSSPAEVGSLPMVLEGSASISANIVNVYDGDTFRASRRRSGDNILGGNILNVISNGDGAKAFGTENDLPKTGEHTVSHWFCINDLGSGGYLWTNTDTSSESRKLGLWFRATGELRFANGTENSIIPEGSLLTGKWYNVIIVQRQNSAAEWINEYFIDGVKGTVVLADPTLRTESGMPVVLGGRLSVQGDSGSALTFTSDTDLGLTIIYDRALTDDECIAAYNNFKGGYVVTGVGSSSMYGDGPASKDDAIFYRLDDKYRGDQNVFWNFGDGGKTFYDGAPDTFSKSPLIGSLVRPIPNTERNITQAVKRYGADVVLVWYPSNFTSSSRDDGPYTFGPRESFEYIDVMAANSKEANQYDAKMVLITPTPRPVGDLAGNGEERADIHFRISQDLLKAGGSVIDAFRLSNPDNNQPAGNYYIGHFNGDAHNQLAVEVEQYFDPFFKLAALVQP